MYVGGVIPTPLEKLKFGAAFDYVDFHNGSVAGNNDNDSIWVAGAYANYQATDKLSFNVRGENYAATGCSVYTLTLAVTMPPQGTMVRNSRARFNTSCGRTC